MFGVGSAWGKLIEWKNEYERGVLLYADCGREVPLLDLLGISDRWPIFWGSMRG
jgi:hypothetical protein